MRVAVASGKGGTGKTTLAVSLATELAARGETVAYADFDVEEPNGHIFLKPTIDTTTPVEVPSPVVDAEKCTLCGRCAEVCRYNAIACLPERVLTFHEICHGCGACSIACPERAISETSRTIGKIERGTTAGPSFLKGELDVGQATSVPVIRQLSKSLPFEGTVVMDAPPGTSCPVMETLRSSDLVILVTEPTPFGLWDLRLAVGVVKVLGLNAAVVINRSDIGDDRTTFYCREEGVRILAEIPNDRAVAEAYARGELPADRSPVFAAAISTVADWVQAAGEVDRP